MNTAVAFIIFRRPDTTRQVFNRIREARPPRLYLIADGPRLDKPGEAAQVQATRAVVAKIDWPCSVQRIYSSRNLGCRDRVISGLDAVFSSEPQAIILEDDCLPHPDFFQYCESALLHYRDENKLMHIGGNNFQPPRKYRKHTVFLTKYPHCWGWATWARAWEKRVSDLSNWAEPRMPQHILGMTDSDAERNFWSHLFGELHSQGNAISSWAYPWQFSIWREQAYCLAPGVPLVRNLGFGEEATHTHSGSSALSPRPRPLGSISHWPLISRPLKSFDEETFRTAYLHQERSWFRKTVNRWRIRLGAWRRKLY